MSEQNVENKTQNFELKMPELLFPNVFKTFRIAIQPGRLLTAFLTLAVIFLVGWVMDFHKTVVVSGRPTTFDLRNSTLSGNKTLATELHCYLNYPERTDNYVKIYSERNKDNKQGVFKVFSSFFTTNFNDTVVCLLQLRFDKVIEGITNAFKALLWIVEYHTIYGIIFLAISFVVLSVGAGAICRGAAMHFSRDERLGFIGCIKFGIRRIVPLVFAPTSPIALACLLGFVIISVLGLIANIPYAGEILLALFFVLVLISGGLVAAAGIWGLGSVSLMYSAIAYEKTDTFDAMCRAYNFVNERPWRLAGYTLVAAFYGSICYLFVRLVGFMMLLAGRWFLNIGLWVQSQKGMGLEKIDAIWPEPEFFNFFGSMSGFALPFTQKISTAVIHFEILIISGLVMAFAFSFYFSAITVIYSLLRKKVDNTSLNSVFIETIQTPDALQA
ncbi:MAG: hypothetical protein A2Y12_14245 [Planctomycetes bacterium GWF2_42_9]|nr:MAG: hypothetical protein A2Y12_14245 [Planctomycetes bacterium GWF2_42_9]HAL45410.1 hypothetical protein [Phycisphaerales bacterium]